MKQGPVVMVVGLLVLGTTVYLGHQTIGSCTLGVHGTSATLTVSGLGALWRRDGSLHWARQDLAMSCRRLPSAWS